MSIKIGIIGYAGRMGQAIGKAVRTHPAATLCGGLEREAKPDLQALDPSFVVTNQPEILFPQCDVLIDFSHATATADYARLAVKYGKAFVSGTTGLDESAKAALTEAAKHIPLLYASNTSLSLVVMKQLVKQAARLLRDHDYDIAIVDEHHRWKKDAPSGTAKTLGEMALAGNGGKPEPAYAAIRAGAIVGEHEVIFAGQGETIRLRHSVTDREIFARGAVQAAVWLHNKAPGLYSMDDVLSIASA